MRCAQLSVQYSSYHLNPFWSILLFRLVVCIATYTVYMDIPISMQHHLVDFLGNSTLRAIIYMKLTAQKEKMTGEKGPAIATMLKLGTYALMRSFSRASHGDWSRPFVHHRSYIPDTGGRYPATLKCLEAGTVCGVMVAGSAAPSMLRESRARGAGLKCCWIVAACGQYIRAMGDEGS